MKVWITKRALTEGILEKEVEDCGNGMVREKNFQVFYHETDWHTDKKSAIAKAEEMRMRRIRTLKTEIKRLEKIKFE